MQLEQVGGAAGLTLSDGYKGMLGTLTSGLNKSPEDIVTDLSTNNVAETNLTDTYKQDAMQAKLKEWCNGTLPTNFGAPFTPERKNAIKDWFGSASDDNKKIDAIVALGIQAELDGAGKATGLHMGDYCAAFVGNPTDTWSSVTSSLNTNLTSGTGLNPIRLLCVMCQTDFTKNGEEFLDGVIDMVGGNPPSIQAFDANKFREAASVVFNISDEKVRGRWGNYIFQGENFLKTPATGGNEYDHNSAPAQNFQSVDSILAKAKPTDPLQRLLLGMQLQFAPLSLETTLKDLDQLIQ